jgi:hypothetical protein
VPGGVARGKLANTAAPRQAGIMKKLSPFAVLVIFGCIGLLTGKFGLWFPVGLATAIGVAILQSKRAG